jgi:hypothetical protein
MITDIEEDPMTNTRTMLIEVLKGGERLKMEDGSVWFINPGDMPTVCTWTPTSPISIVAGRPTSAFPYTITNLGNGISVKAMKFKKASR